MPDSICNCTSPIPGVSEPLEQPFHVQTTREAYIRPCLGSLRRFVQLRSRGRVGLLPAPLVP